MVADEIHFLDAESSLRRGIVALRRIAVGHAEEESRFVVFAPWRARIAVALGSKLRVSP